MFGVINMEMKKTGKGNESKIDLLNLTNTEILEIISALKDRSNKFVNENKNFDHNKSKKIYNRIILLLHSFKNQ